MLHIKHKVSASIGLPQPWGQFNKIKQTFCNFNPSKPLGSEPFFFMQRSPHCFSWKIPTQRGLQKITSLGSKEGCIWFLLQAAINAMELSAKAFFCLLGSFLYSSSCNFCPVIFLLGMILFDLLLSPPFPLHPAENVAGRITANSFACLPIRSIPCQSQVSKEQQGIWQLSSPFDPLTVFSAFHFIKTRY